ncbi:uncharacterized protein RCC_04741 [Ramularia collo-cygni]|uniref:Metalloendopeptidase n=1 Tax=Ramularia collo-cygni TaxID=112498 RepID=A0A2D3V5T8_9PEZI|nr:uncharacterized protein RCC_04741 [Ramularia collo-cygni]CZT18896.1 uncharacterized protein RCC_04741 [Ramularia collo-cygni]
MLSAVALLLVSLICSAQSCSLHRRYQHDSFQFPQDFTNNSITAHPGHELLKRWYGVKTLPAPGADQSYLSPYYYPWPVTCSSPKVVQPIRYCFKDKRSAKNLQAVVDRSIAAWSQATLVSSLAITVEPTCRDKNMCICSGLGVAKDALMISDETIDGNDEWNHGPECYTASTVGYRYAPKGQPIIPHRHYMKFCSYAPQYSWGQFEEAERDMGHEWGHVMGLQHEHQRPDRNEYIYFKCKNLKGYEQAYEKADIDEEGWFDDDDHGEELSMKEKMSRICNHELYASKFFPAVLEYIRGDAQHMDTVESQAIVNNMVKSDRFDFESIMMYDADLMSIDKAGKKYVLFRRGPGGSVGAPVWMGGGVNGDLKSTKLSEGDIARVSMLYDSGHTKEDVSWGPVRVKIGGRLDVVVPAPRKRNEL